MMCGMLRLLRMARLLRYMERWEKASMLSGNVLRLVRLVVVMLFFSHWNGCIQFLIASIEGIDEESWPVRGGLIDLHNCTDDMPEFEQYSWAFYNAVSQMLAIGPGRTEPERVSEMWVFLISMIIGATIYGIFVASLTAVMADADASAREYRAKIDMVSHCVQLT